MKRHILDCEQSHNRTYLCSYCERKVRPETTHIEHIRPRSKFPKLSLSYDNLMVSCGNSESCGRYKENRWKDTFINPLEEDPEACIHYSAEGKIRENGERVKDTVSILNLNHSALTDIRRTIFLQLSRYPKEYIEKVDQFFDDFPSLVRYYQKNYIAGNTKQAEG